MADHVDVVIVGAGLSGIGAAHQLQEKCPGKSYVILESRESSGGTWDLFRYPGVRSDSDMYTLGYRLRPWTGGRTTADGLSILRYVRQTAAEQGIDRHIRFGHRLVAAQWSSEAACWTLRIAHNGEMVELTCAFLYCCSGYYSYDQGYTPLWPAFGSFAGTVVHPQHWPDDLDVKGRRIVVIGSGATAVTLVPALAETAEHVTMLQWSPTYMVALATSDPMGDAIRRLLPPSAAFVLVRWKNVLTTMAFYRFSRRWPAAARRLLRRGVRRSLPEDFDVDTHFAPRYNPWDQRLCVVPDGDLFRAIRSGRASIVTDQIARFTPEGVTLASGAHLPADLVVTATGLNLLAFGGVELVVDGRTIALNETMAYKSLMLSGVPNFAFAVGYTNASWTLKVDLTSEYVCRLLNLMDANGYSSGVPVPDPAVDGRPFLDFRANYVLRSLEKFPQQGSRAPWRVTMNYLRDLRALRYGSLTQNMAFEPASPGR